MFFKKEEKKKNWMVPKTVGGSSLAGLVIGIVKGGSIGMATGGNAFGVPGTFVGAVIGMAVGCTVASVRIIVGK
jgi:uncharacterized protein YcfJ